jgi:hypothetical protein
MVFLPDTPYSNSSNNKFRASGGIEDTYVRGAYDSNVVKVQVLSRPPFSKLMEFKVAHVVAFFALRCVGTKNNSHTSLLI